MRAHTNHAEDLEVTVHHGDPAGRQQTGQGPGHGDQAGHGSHAGHGDHAAMFRRLFWGNLLLALPVIATSHMVAEFLGYTPPQFPGAALVGPLLGTAIFLWGGRPFLAGGVAELRSRRPGMMPLIATAISVAFAASAATSLGLFDLEFWWELAALIVIMLLGHWQEMRAIGQASGALSALAALLPDDADLVTTTGVQTVPLDALVAGDVVLVRPGARIPADGVVADGAAAVDESMITGESQPVARAAGDRVVAGTVATDGALRITVGAIGEATALAGIRRLVEQAQASNSRAQALADRAAAWLFWFALGAGIITFLAWTLVGAPQDAVVRTVTVLVIACPHALGLAIPLVISISTATAAHNGILVKDRLALERMRTVDAVLFDKTGTLTRGAHVLHDVAVAAADLDEDRLLAIAAAAEADSEHPLARAIVSTASARGPVPTAADFASLTGRGVEATVEGHRVAVGGPSLLRERGLGLPSAMSTQFDAWSARGAATLAVIRDGAVVGAFALEDQVRPESRQAVDSLHELGIRVVMITGDARSVADAVAADLGIDEVFAEVLPHEKDRAVTELQSRGLRVAMVGDGVNDAPALARADVGIAIGAGTDVAIESAGVVLASSDPRAVLGVIRLSRASYRKMVQNLVWATGYNVVAVPLAAGALAWAGISLPPAVGALLMSASTIVVAVNAQLLRGLDLRAAPLSAA